MERETYENIREIVTSSPRSLSPEVRERWIKADQGERALREAYRKLEADEDLTPEAKARHASELYEERREQIETKKRRAREALLKSAKSARQSAIPRPAGEALSSSDATKLIADQNEAARLIRTIEHRQDAGGLFKFSSVDFLRDEYRRGLRDLEGAEAGTVCRGVLLAAGELGVSYEELLNPLRAERHNESLDSARRLEVAADMISTSAPKPPRSLSKANGRGGSYRVAPITMPDNREVVPEKVSKPRRSQRKKSFS